MGSECSVYKDYELEEPIECSSSEWILYPAHSKTTTPEQRVTVFVHKKTKHERRQDKSQSVTKSYQFLKVLRHPGILKYYSSYDNAEVVMVTEPVEPLENVLNSLDVDEIVTGLNQIVQALVFLHEKGGLSHNNVCLSSIYVSNNDGSWKLGGMQCVCKPEHFNKKFIEDIKPLRNSKSSAPEEDERDFSLSRQTLHTIDAHGFGMLFNDILDIRDDIGDSSFLKFSELIQNSFLHPDPKYRPKLNTLLEEEFFKNDYLEILTFLNNITIKSDIDKDKFFSSLASKLRKVSSEVVATRLLPKLMSRFVMAEPSAEKEFLPHLLTPGSPVIENESESTFPVLPLDLFKKYCLPILFKLWAVKDVHIRIILLKYFPLSAKAFEVKDLEQVILPQILIGLRDTDDSLVSATFYALANLVPILGGAVVVGGERQKYFKEGRPKFSLGTSSSPQVNDHRKFSFDEPRGRKGSAKKKNPVNASDALNMKRVPEPLPKMKTEFPTKTNMENERVRMEKKKGIVKKKSPFSENEDDSSTRTLLDIAKEHKEIVKTEDEDEKGENTDSPTDTIDNDDDDEWEDFQMGDVVSNMESDTPILNSKDKTSPSRFTTKTSTTNNYDISDIDFTQRRASHDLITWDNVDTNINQSKPASGKAMKLGNKKKTTAKPKPNPNNLGQMFEVPDISVKSTEPDFFADMQPTVEFQSYGGSVGGENAKSGYSKTMDVAPTAQVGEDWEVDDWTSFD